MKALSKLLPEEHVVSRAAFQAFSKPVGKYGNSVCIKVQTRSDYFHIVGARKSTRCLLVIKNIYRYVNLIISLLSLLKGSESNSFYAKVVNST